MTLRWYGSSFDTVTLKQIRQIPGVTGVITTLYDTAPGEVWSRERIHAMKEDVEANGLHVSGIESVNVHDAIKIGNKDRDLYINNYIETLENLGKEDIHLVCYNFMPVFDWTRTELARKRPDGSTVLAYTQAAVDALNLEDMFHSIFSVFIKGIGGKGDDRDTGEGRIFESTDFSGGSITIHNRHLNVHKNGIIEARCIIGEFFHGNGSVFRSIYDQSTFFQNCRGNFTIHTVVLHKKNSFSCKKLR